MFRLAQPSDKRHAGRETLFVLLGTVMLQPPPRPVQNTQPVDKSDTSGLQASNLLRRSRKPDEGDRHTGSHAEIPPTVREPNAPYSRQDAATQSYRRLQPKNISIFDRFQIKYLQNRIQDSFSLFQLLYIFSCVGVDYMLRFRFPNKKRPSITIFSP